VAGLSPFFYKKMKQKRRGTWRIYGPNKKLPSKVIFQAGGDDGMDCGHVRW